MLNADQIDSVARKIVDCSYQVHRHLGPGLLEAIYQRCLAYELGATGINVQCAVPLPVVYKGRDIGMGYQLDMIVEGVIVIENKAVQALHPVHHAQLLTYLRLSNLKLGFLINWNVPVIKGGIKRVANGF